MRIHLPSDLEARPVPYEPCPAITRRPDQETGYRVHAVFQALSPLNNPVEGCSHAVWERPLNPGMKIDKIDWAWTGSSQDPEVVPFREQCIKCSECIRIGFRMVSARNIRLGAEAGFQHYRWKSIARFGRNSPRSDIGRSECSELPERLVVEVPTGSFGRDRPRQSCAESMTQLVRGTPLKSCTLAVQSQVIRLERNFLGERLGRIYSPKGDLVVGSIIEESRLIQIGPHSKSVNSPGIDFCHYLETIEAKPDIGALTHVDQATRTIFHLLPA